MKIITNIRVLEPNRQKARKSNLFINFLKGSLQGVFYFSLTILGVVLIAQNNRVIWGVLFIGIALSLYTANIVNLLRIFRRNKSV